MGCPIRPSTVRVCRFRHPGSPNNLAYHTILPAVRQHGEGKSPVLLPSNKLPLYIGEGIPTEEGPHVEGTDGKERLAASRGNGPRAGRGGHVRTVGRSSGPAAAKGAFVRSGAVSILFAPIHRARLGLF